MFGPLSRLPDSQGCCRKFWTTLSHRSHLPGVAGSHLHSVLPTTPHTHCLQSLDELSPATVCLLLAFPVGFMRLPRFQPQWFVTRSSVSQPLWVTAAVLRQFSRNLATLNEFWMEWLRYLKVCQAI